MAAKILKSTVAISLFLTVLTFSAIAHAKIITVDDDGPANFNTIQAAIDDANNGDVVEIQPGRYTGPGNRDIDYNGKAITVRSTYPNDPNVVAATIIDCNGTEIEPHRGFYFHNVEGPNSILAGITITNGMGAIEDFYSGFGTYLSSIGGAILCTGSSPKIMSCSILGNEAFSYGGGICFSNSDNAIMINCELRGNLAERGGAIFAIDSSPIVDRCIFTSNSSGRPWRDNFGAGMYNFDSSPLLIDCTFYGNLASRRGGYGGGMYNYQSGTTLVNCTFAENSASAGGGMHNRLSSPTLLRCTFTANLGSGRGGGINNDYSNAVIKDCTFIGNRSSYNGGGMNNNDHSNFVADNCTFFNNIATWGRGGSMRNSNSDPVIRNCIFVSNSAKFGGAVWNYRNNGFIIDCILSGNLAEEYGGGMHIDDCDLTLTNCTFVGNFASNGKALACDSWQSCQPSNLLIVNCILWDAADEIWNNDSSTITITYSDVQSGWEGEGNIDADPCFIEPGYWADANDPNIIVEPNDTNAFWIDGDYHLLPDSPCIDAGDPNYIPEPNETDLDGKPRVMGGRVDMGAYEYRPLVSAEAKIVPRTISLASSGKWIAVFIWLPEEYDVADIEPKSVFFANEIQPEEFSVDEQQQVAMARFNRNDVQAILEVGDIELTITGQLADGTVFEGKDTIKVLNKAGKN